MNKKFSEWLAENYDKKSTKSLKNAHKPMESLSGDEDLNDRCLMDLMEHIANMAADQGSPKQLIQRPLLAFYATELGNRLEITPMQALLLALFVNMYPDKRIETKDIARFISCSNIAIMGCYQDIQALCEKGYLLERKSSKEERMDYQVPFRVITAFQKNSIVKPQDYSNMNGDDMITMLSDTIQAYIEDDIDEKELQFTTSAIINSNQQLTFCRQINEYGLTNDEKLLLLNACCGFYYNQHFTLDTNNIRMLFRPSAGIRYIRLLRNDKHPLIEKKLLESSGGELANSDEWSLSHRAAVDLMSELCPITSTSAKQGVIDAESIGKKALFYPTKTAKQISELEDLLSPDKFSRVQKCLEAHGMRKGFACLFYGLPGTGKTETVLQLARKTWRDIMQVDMSQMRDKYVGESEKNVNQIFTRYRRLCHDSALTPILLLNEADALLSVRLTKVEHSVDQMANTMQNILLQEMENFDGILIATTNLTQNLDRAFDRRFLYKVEFLKPTPEESRHIWQAMLPEISEEDAWMLAKQYAFSGGQIENIARKQIVNAILFPEEGRDLNKIRQACDSEYLNKNQTRPIGFC